MIVVDDKLFDEVLKSVRNVQVAGEVFDLLETVNVDVNSLNPHPSDEVKLWTTVMNFERRGDWLTHPFNTRFNGNTSPYVLMRLLNTYTQTNDLVYDPMCGSGTTAIECLAMKRRYVVSDVNPACALLTYSRLRPLFKIYDNIGIVGIEDARNVKYDEVAKFTFIHPPYAKLVEYSTRNDDISRLSLEEYFDVMESIYRRFTDYTEMLAIQIGDLKIDNRVVPLCELTYNILCRAGWRLLHKYIKIQHNTTFGKFVLSKSPPVLTHEIVYVMTIK